MNDQTLHDLDQRAATAAADLRARAAARPVPAFDPDRPVSLPSPGGHGPTLPSRRPLMAVAALLALLVGAMAWIGTRGDDDGDIADVRTGPIQPHLAGELPAGLKLAGVSNETGRAAEGEGDARIGPISVFGPAADRPELGAFLVPSIGSDQEGATSIPVGDRTGRLLDGGGMRALMVPVDDPEGRWLYLMNATLEPEALARLADAATVDGETVRIDGASLPPGWTTLASGLDTSTTTGILGPLGATGGTAFAYYAGSKPDVSVTVSTSRGDEMAAASLRMLVAEVDELTVRGHRAYVGSMYSGSDGTDAWVVSWQERPGEVVRVTGIGISRAETLAVAEGVRAADDAEWADLVEQTLLGDLRTDLSEMEELGRGRFADGTAWVLRLRPASSGPKGESSASIDLSVAIAGDGDTSSSFSSVGTAIDGPGGETPAPPTFSATTVRRQAGRAFGAGLLTDRVTVVEVVQADGRTRWLAEIVRANGVVAWVAEIPADATELVARDATGAEVGRETIPQESADGSSGDGSGSSSGSGSNGSETTVVVGTPIGPTTTTG